MILTLVVMLLMRKGWKKILLTFVGFIVALGLFNLYVNKTCGPDSKDVEIMTPQAEAISNYILKNGIPESLTDISGLPYSLENCKWIEVNNEWCTFNVSGIKYSTDFYFLDSSISIKVYNRTNETGILFGFKKEKTGKWSIRKKLTPYSTKNDGVCNPLRM